MESKKEKVVKGIVNIAGATVITAMVVALISLYSGVASIRKVEGKSMQPTFHDGDKLLTLKCKEYNRGDIVVFDTHSDGTYIKRIIGLPGDTIEIKHGSLYINGDEQYEDYLIVQYTENGEMYGKVTLPTNKYFVLGDNREVSDDSRYSNVGLVDLNDIVGKCIVKL